MAKLYFPLVGLSMMYECYRGIEIEFQPKTKWSVHTINRGCKGWASSDEKSTTITYTSHCIYASTVTFILSTNTALQKGVSETFGIYIYTYQYIYIFIDHSRYYPPPPTTHLQATLTQQPSSIPEQLFLKYRYIHIYISLLLHFSVMFQTDKLTHKWIF